MNSSKIFRGYCIFSIPHGINSSSQRSISLNYLR